MIKLNVAEIKKNLVGEKSFQYELEPSDLDLTTNDLPLIGKVKVEGTVQNGGDVILLSAKLSGRVKRQCGRCLKEFEEQTHAQVEERYYPKETEGLSDDVFTYEFDIVDITEGLREGLLLAEPINVLCKPDCKGLCPVCGSDRNVTTCNCDTTTIDPRLIALKKFFNK